MGTWYVRPLTVGGWQVLTPYNTQAGVSRSRTEAVRMACIMVGDEGGGSVITLTEYGDPEDVDSVLPSVAPYFRSVRPPESPRDVGTAQLAAEGKAS